MKNYNVLTFLFVTFCLIQLSAQNLVINPSFENVTACPVGIGEFFRATDWDDINSGADSCSSPDLIAGCAPGFGGANSPNMLLGYQASRTGNNHAGIILYEGFALTGCTPLFSDNYREYIGGSLSTPLIAGQTYCVSFYISLADNVKWGVNSIGVFFSNGPYQHNFCTSGSPAPVTPQLQYSGGVLSDTTNWVRLQWNYTASGGETHFVIGNFNNDAATVRGDVNCSAFNPYAYYFIDDVSVEAGACTINCPTITVSGIINDVSCGSSNNGSIDITPSGGASPYTYQWSNASTAEDLSSLIAGSYGVTVTDNNACTGTFTGSVGSSPGLSLNSNPTNVSCSGGNDGAAAVLVSGAPGPYTFSWSTGQTTSQITGLSAGVYNVTVSTSGSGSTTDTLYQQDFSAAHGWTLNVATGTNSATPNAWFVNAEEGGGILPPGCGIANNGNNSLHISCTSFGCEPPFNLLTGALYDATQQTNRRAESPVFSTVGYTGITLNFNYISLGDALLDNASVFYNDGGGWQVLDPSIKSPICGSGQGQWTAFSAVLPASCDNNPNVQVAINWTNNNDNIGTDPSIAVDNFVVTSLGNGGTTCTGVQTVTITEPSAISVANVQEICNTIDGTYVLEFDVNGGTAPYTVTGISGSFSGNQFTSNSLTGAQSYTITDNNNCQLPQTASGTCSSSVSNCNFTNGCFSNNLLANSDFENYNPTNPFQFFTSGFTPNNTNGTCTPGANCNGSFLCQGGFAISNSPTPCNPTWPTNIRDHTSGTGNMMLVDFPNTGSIPIWCQNINLAPNTIYCFGAWYINLLPEGSNQGLPQFRYTINGISFDTTALLQEDETWHFYGVQFNSGLGGPTDLCIYNQNAGFVGFDLAIDDISLREVINGTLPQLSNDTIITCANRAVTFNPSLNDAGAPGTVRILTSPPFTAGSASIIGNNITFTPAAGFADTTSMEYELCVSGCCSSGVVTLIVNPNPTTTLSISTNSICLGDSALLTAGPLSSSYNWSLNGTQFLTGSNNLISVGNSGSYSVVVTDNNSCSATSNPVSLNIVSPTVTLTGQSAFCSPSSGSYTASGGDFYTFFLNGAVAQVRSTNNIFNSATLNDGDRIVVEACRGLIYDGVINESSWGSPLATSVGGPAPGFGAGHEINAIYGAVSADSVYIALAGNVQNNNRILVFIDSKTGGYSNGNFGRNAAPQGIDDFNSGSSFDVGFLPDYCMVIGTDASQTNYFWDLYELSGTAGSGGGPNNFLGDLSSNSLHASPLNSSQTRGFESGISKAELGMTGNSFSIMAMYSSDAGFLSNQFMTPAASTDGNYTNGVVDFDQAVPNPITVSAFLNNCCAFDTIDIDVSSPSISISSTNVTCNGQANGTATVSVTGASNPISFLWSNGASTASVNDLVEGTYIVTVTANGCSVSSAVTITQASSVTISSVVSNTSCFSNNGSINLTVSGGTLPFTYTWSNGASSQNLAGLSAGSYTVTVSDATLCTTVSTIVVNSASTSTVTLDSVVNVNCNGDNNGSIYISAISGPTACSSATVVINEVMYRPSTFDGNSADPLLTGEYIELIGPPGTDISCYVLSDGDWAITIPPGTIIPADGIYTLGHNSSPYAIANGITYDLDVANCGCFTAGTSGNGILIFTNGGEYVGLYDNSGSFLDGLLYGTPSAGNTPPSGAITTGGVINTIGLVGCPATINIATTGYQTHPGGVVGGTSLVRIPDGAGGTWSTQVGGSANLCNSSASSNFTYLWSNGASTEDVSGLSAGVYTVTVTDPLGCDNIITATVTEPSALVTNTTSITDANCSAPGAIDINVSGGIPIYSFVWSNGGTTEDLSGLSAGSYDVTITDGNGCTVTNLANTVNSSGIPIINIQSTTASSCNGTSDGAADISISDGTPVYSFVWSNGSTTEDLNNVSSGSYTVTVTDALGCIDSLSVTINEPSVIISAVSITEVNCSDANGAIEFAVGGGNGGFTFIWNTGSTDQNISGLSSGNYSVTATDANGCEVIQNFTISAPYQPSLSAFIGQAGIVDSTILLGESIIVNVGNDETANGVSYQWSSIPNTANFVDVNSVSTEVTPDPSGDYLILITATSIDGCSDTDTIQLTVNPFEDPRIPTAFSPNGDNLNDIFKVVDLDVTYLKEFKVFSRWGQLVCDNLNGQWDGTFKGVKQPRDVYIFIISWQRPNDPDPVVNRGNVTLLR